MTRRVRWLAAGLLVLGACGGGRDSGTTADSARGQRLEMPASARADAAQCERPAADGGLVGHRRVGADCRRTFNGFDAQLAPASRRVALAKATATPVAALPPALTITELFDWAEQTYPQYFPSHQANRTLGPYTYRYYGNTQNHVAVAGDEVYVQGPVSGGGLAYVGTLASFACLVHASQCAEPKPCTAVASWSANGSTCTPNADQAGQVASGTTVSYLDSAGPTRGSASYTCSDGVMTAQGTPQCEPADAVACNTAGLSWTANGNTCAANSGEPTQVASGATHTFQASASTVGSATYRCTDGTLTATAAPSCAAAPAGVCRPTTLSWSASGLNCSASAVPAQVAMGGIFTVTDLDGQPTGQATYRCTNAGLELNEPPACVDVARMQDSFGGDGGASDGGASGDGTAGDGAPIVGGLVKVRDRFGRVTSATTDHVGYFRVKLTGFVPPLLVSVTRRDGVVRRSLSLQPLKTNGYVFIAVTGLTDKIASDLGRALGFAGAAGLTPQLVHDNQARVAEMLTALRNDAVVRPILVSQGIAPESFNPFTAPFRADGTGYDGVLDRLQVTTDPTGTTVVRSLDCEAPKSWTVDGVTCTPDANEELRIPNNQSVSHRDSVGPTTGSVGWSCKAGVLQPPFLPTCR